MDQVKLNRNLERLVSYAAGTTTMALLAIADRNGLLKYLAGNTPATAEIISDELGLDPRYTTEILSGLVAADILTYDPEDQVFGMTPEQSSIVADETSPYFLGGWFDMLPAMYEVLPQLVEASISGGGVRFEDYGPLLIRGLDRANGPSQRVLLVRKWLPGVPSLVPRLESGIRVADVGCGSGVVAAVIAEAFPKTEVVAIDQSENMVALAVSRHGEVPNLRFHRAEVSEVAKFGSFDLVTSFDVVHDLADPHSALAAIWGSLSPQGQLLMLEPRVEPDLEDNVNPRAALIYGTSVLHCMSQSLALGGIGLGTAWGPRAARKLASETGFSRFEILEDISNRFSLFYLLNK